MSAVLRQSV